MKEKILRKLTRASRKNKILRYPMLAVIFVFLAVWHFGTFLKRQELRFCGVLCVLIIFLLSSSFALPALFDINAQQQETSVYVSDLEEMVNSGDLSGISVEEGFEDDGLNGYETYDVNTVDKYTLDEILLEHEEYLKQKDQEEQVEIPSDPSDEPEKMFKADDWQLILVNKNHPIPSDYSFSLTTITGTMQCDARILDDLLLMLRAARNDNVNLIVCSPYRPPGRQEVIFKRHITAYMNRGLNYLDSFKLASQEATVPGSSEHQIGLSLDIYTASHLTLDDAFGETAAGKWLAAHCSEYGFILRYPKGKEYITSINYEPWHFRYVGRDAAKIIMSEGITLEEFWDRYVY